MSTWRSLRRGSGICPVCGMWMWHRIAGKFGVKSVCPNAGRKDHALSTIPEVPS